MLTQVLYLNSCNNYCFYSTSTSHLRLNSHSKNTRSHPVDFHTVTGRSAVI